MTHYLDGTKVTGLHISGFRGDGINAAGLNRLDVEDVDLATNDQEGAEVSLAKQTVFTSDLFSGNHGGGVAVDESPAVAVTITSSQAINNQGEGFLLASVHGRAAITKNLSYGNCLGIGFVDATPAGDEGPFAVENNEAVGNNLGCPKSPDAPAISGIDIVLHGAGSTIVNSNLALDNRPALGYQTNGGIIVTDQPTRSTITVSHNTALLKGGGKDLAAPLERQQGDHQPVPDVLALEPVP